MPMSVVVNPFFDWTHDRAPRRPNEETVIYQAHVRGMTMRHPQVPPELRGTYAGLAHPKILQHLTDLGVTAVQLMPVQQFVHDHRLVERGLRNYWGYNPIGFFAPHNEYAASGRQVTEFKEMVRAMHEVGLEVILDVARHTAEGDHKGPTLSFRGIDNASYYRLGDERRDGESNLDGTSENHSWNRGAEGLTDDPAVNQLRDRQQRNLLATVLLARGLPMLSHGDELGRTQQGNNHAFCQDTELTWIDWDNTDSALHAFVRTLTRLRADHPVFRQNRYLTGQGTPPDVAWLRPSGDPMTDTDWNDPERQTLMMLLNGATLPDRTPRGARVVDDSFLVLFHAGPHRRTCVLPTGPWSVQLYTAGTNPLVTSTVVVQPYSLLVLRHANDEQSE